MSKKQYIYDNQGSLWGEPDVVGFGDDSFRVQELGREKANTVIIENHYSGKVYNATYIHLGVYVEGELKGVLQYGYAMNPASCGSVVEGTEKDQYLELNRMWIADDAGKYPESRAISASVKYIKRKYPKIKWIQSFADERCGGFGIVYQACSFSYYGEHKAEFWEHPDGEVFHTSMITDSRMKGQPRYEKAVKAKSEGLLKKHSLRQFRYIKFLDSKWKKRCKHQEQPYPKFYLHNTEDGHA